jgi:hypothetical protein
MQDFSSIVENKFSWIFLSIRICWVPKFFWQKWIFFSLYNICPRLLSNIEKFLKLLKFFQHPGKYFSGILESAQFFGGRMEENSWVSPSCKTFCISWIQHRVKLTPSYYFIYSLRVKSTGVEGWKNPKFLGSSDGFHERTPNFWAVPTAFLKEPQISGQFSSYTLEPVLCFPGNSS